MAMAAQPTTKGTRTDYKDLTPEQMEKAKACKSAEELVALAKEEGVELSDDMVEGVAGGAWECESALDDLE